MSLKAAQEHFYTLCFGEIAPAGGGREVIYRRLVRRNMRDCLRFALPLFFGFLTEGQTQSLITRFLSLQGVRSPYYREIVAHFADFALLEEHPFPFLKDLLDYESASYELTYRENTKEEFREDGRKALEQARLIANPNTYLKDYSFAVHRIKPGFSGSEIQPQATSVIIYRNPQDFRVETYPLNAEGREAMKAILAKPDAGIGEIWSVLGNPPLESLLPFIKVLLDKKILLAIM